jgi:hypothetical protein
MTFPAGKKTIQGFASRSQNDSILHILEDYNPFSRFVSRVFLHLKAVFSHFPGGRHLPHSPRKPALIRMKFFLVTRSGTAKSALPARQVNVRSNAAKIVKTAQKMPFEGIDFLGNFFV